MTSAKQTLVDLLRARSEIRDKINEVIESAVSDIHRSIHSLNKAVGYKRLTLEDTYYIYHDDVYVQPKETKAKKPKKEVTEEDRRLKERWKAFTKANLGRYVRHPGNDPKMDYIIGSSNRVRKWVMYLYLSDPPENSDHTDGLRQYLYWKEKGRDSAGTD